MSARQILFGGITVKNPRNNEIERITSTNKPSLRRATLALLIASTGAGYMLGQDLSKTTNAESQTMTTQNKFY